jgi:intracellular sulfur oxidation DsrE/DsrF family protein
LQLRIDKLKQEWNTTDNKQPVQDEITELEAILPEMSYVKMGIGEIVLKQEAGWIYIKAGF